MMLKNKEPYKDKVVNYEEIIVKRNALGWIRALLTFGYLVKSDYTIKIVGHRDPLKLAS
jgi:hypothetical protein